MRPSCLNASANTKNVSPSSVWFFTAGNTSLDLFDNGIGAEGAQALKDLVNLTSLDLSHNGIGDEGAQALKDLVNRTSLNLGYDRIGAEGAQALKGLVNLTSLNLNGNSIGDEGAQALKGLVNLTGLYLEGNCIGDISPLASLRNLRRINLSDNHLNHVVLAFWMLPSLQEAIVNEASLLGVPVEILSNDGGDNCLHRLRAHLTDLTGNDVAVGDVKLMILGNGRVGKTQICRRLRGKSFDEAVPSTHGIQVSSQRLAPHVSDGQVTLKIWDFGGQDIYHGTHALFLKSRAVFPLVWTPKSETEQFHMHGGFTFRNQPLVYWLAYVRTFGGAQSPVLVIQSQCDCVEDERDPPLPPGALDGFGYKTVLHYSAKGDGTHARGHAALVETLLDAVQWLRRDQGLAKIGPGRAAVKEALEAKLAAGVLANDLGHQFIGMETALHQCVSLAGTNELHSLLGCRMAVRLVDDLQPGNVQFEGAGECPDACFGTHQDRLDDFRRRRIDGRGERAFIAGMGDGRPHRRQGMAAVNQRLVFVVLAQLIHRANLRSRSRSISSRMKWVAHEMQGS
jgi:hypothetical protein